MPMISCRLCKNSIATPSYSTPAFPNYIWPVSLDIIKEKKVNLSPCEVYHCVHCGHLQLQHFTDAEVASFYCHGSFVEENLEHKKIRLKHILDFGGENFFKNKKVIDVGGGNNPFVKLIKEYTSEIYVNDFAISEECRSVIGDKYFEGKLEDCTIPTNEFDIALSFHSLEHLENPQSCLAKIHKSLKLGGKFVVELPNIAWVVKHLPYYAVFHQHISLFHEDSFVNLMESMGFRLEKILRNDSVLMGAFEKVNERKVVKTVKHHYVETLRENLNLIEHGLHEFISNNQPKNLAVYTAGGSATLLIHHFEDLKANVHYCFDRDELKQFKFIPGSRIEILPPDKMEKADAVIFLSEGIRDLFKGKLSIPHISVESIFKNGK